MIFSDRSLFYVVFWIFTIFVHRSSISKRDFHRKLKRKSVIRKIGTSLHKMLKILTNFCEKNKNVWRSPCPFYAHSRDPKCTRHCDQFWSRFLAILDLSLYTSNTRAPKYVTRVFLFWFGRKTRFGRASATFFEHDLETKINFFPKFIQFFKYLPFCFEGFMRRREVA